MLELALLFDSDSSKIIHLLYGVNDIEGELRPIMINDIIVLTHIAGIMIAIAFACLIIELIYKHLKQKSIRRVYRKFKVYYRLFKRRLDRLQIVFSLAFHNCMRSFDHRRPISVRPIQ